MNFFTNFNAAEIEPSNAPLDVLPAGKYTAMIVGNETRPTKAGTGERLNLTFEIVEGEFAGRKVWAGLNVKNPNQQAVEISMRELSSICRAVGVMTPKSADDLHDKPMIISVKVRPASEQYSASNEINGYAPLKGQAPVAQQQASAPVATPPWKR